MLECTATYSQFGTRRFTDLELFSVFYSIFFTFMAGCIFVFGGFWRVSQPRFFYFIFFMGEKCILVIHQHCLKNYLSLQKYIDTAGCKSRYTVGGYYTKYTQYIIGWYMICLFVY